MKQLNGKPFPYSISFLCPKCQMSAKHGYRADELDAYLRDCHMHASHTLICGNCENGVDARKDDYGPAKKTGGQS